MSRNGRVNGKNQWLIIDPVSRSLDNEATAPSFNGRTADSGSAYRGSNPWGAARFQTVFTRFSSSYPLKNRGQVACLAKWGVGFNDAANRIPLLPNNHRGTLLLLLQEPPKIRRWECSNIWSAMEIARTLRIVLSRVGNVAGRFLLEQHLCTLGLDRALDVGCSVRPNQSMRGNRRAAGDGRPPRRASRGRGSYGQRVGCRFMALTRSFTQRNGSRASLVLSQI
jgi:hypothetical protein